MIVKVTLSGIIDTNQQDKFLKEALENLINGMGDSEEDSKLVVKTFKPRFGEANLGVKLLKK